MTHSYLLRSLIAALIALTALPAAAQYEGRTLEDVVNLEFLPGWRQSDGTHMAGLLIRLAPGWKTYWRAPGEAGIPPNLRLRDRRGLEGAEIYWPVPEVFHTNGMRSIGYSQDVVLPLQLTVAEGHGPLRLSGRIEIGVCQDICMPVTLNLRGMLPVGGAPDPRILAALADRPLNASEAGVGTVTCQLTPIADGLRVEARIPLGRQGAAETVVFELPDSGVWISEAETSRAGGTLTATADIIPADAGPFAMDRSNLRITVLAQNSAVDIRGCRG